MVRLTAKREMQRIWRQESWMQDVADGQQLWEGVLQDYAELDEMADNFHSTLHRATEKQKECAIRQMTRITNKCVSEQLVQCVTRWGRRATGARTVLEGLT
eukprot:TRINITY_DN62038_c0_g1_i1.p2 TRINITY_DN62038_c0_g1~~TRINITY_DN62038_c0_g1_i1.p2  ORF type:complete len:101 (+),score=16.79 TRINITY_DN62038_c0_g1_i1:103-405(+)